MPISRMLALLGAVIVFFSELHAGGIILYEIGTQAIGLASAGWAARAEDPSIAFTNPAGMSRLSCREVEFGLEPIYSRVHFDPNAETTIAGKKGDGSVWIPSGGVYYVEPVNETWTVGVSMLGYFGSKLKFNHSWVGRYYLTELLLQGYSFVPAISCQMTDKLSFGVGVQAMYSLFKQKSAVNNFLDGLPDGSLKLYDDDFGFGCLVGLLYEFTPSTRIGVQYVSKVRLQFRCKPHFSNVGPTLRNAVKNSGVSSSQVLLDIDVPQCVMLSVYHDLTDNLAIMGNAGWQEWSDFQKASIVLGSATAPSLTAIPKYKNTWHAALGARYRLHETLALMAGLAYDSAAVSAKNRPLDFPVGRQWRYGAGLEWCVSPAIQVGVDFTLMTQGNLYVDVERGPLAGRVSGKFKNLFVQFFNFNLQWIF